MALKDWEKVKEKTLTWKNKKTEDIIKIEYYPGRNIYRYQVMLNRGVLKYFDYVKQASKFAKEYMRKH